MAQHIDLLFLPALLAKAVIRKNSTISATNFTAYSALQFARDEYIIKVLEAPVGIRDTVRTMAQAGAAGSIGQTQLFCTLTMFEALSPDQKVEFILAYRACATLATQGGREVVDVQSWDPLHIPPRQEP